MQTPEDKEIKSVKDNPDQETVQENAADIADDNTQEHYHSSDDYDLYSVDDYDIDFDATTTGYHIGRSSFDVETTSSSEEILIPEIDIKGLREEYSAFGSADASTSGVNDRVTAEKPPVAVKDSKAMASRNAPEVQNREANPESSNVLAKQAVMRDSDSTEGEGYIEEMVVAKGSLGEWLQESRRENHMEVEEVASRLRIKPEAVRAIEQNDFGSVGAPVFARGYIRNYAKLLGLPIEQVLKKYAGTPEVASTAPELTDTVASVKKTPETKLINIPYGRMISLLLLLLPLYLAYQYLPWSQWFANLETPTLTGETNEVILPPDDIPAIDSNVLINSNDSSGAEAISEAQSEEQEPALEDIIIEPLLDNASQTASEQSSEVNNDQFGEQNDEVVTDATLGLALGQAGSSTGVIKTDQASNEVAANIAETTLVTEAVAASATDNATPKPAQENVDINAFLEVDPGAIVTTNNGAGVDSSANQDDLVAVPKPQAEVVAAETEVAKPKPDPVDPTQPAPKRNRDGKIVKTFTHEELLGTAESKSTQVNGSKTIVFNFTGECWAQVTEADSGKVILSRTLQAGQVRTIKSAKRLKVVLGNPSVVRLTVNGQQKNAKTNGSGVARFEL
jgi:cytoskeletal protein RodZ